MGLSRKDFYLLTPYEFDCLYTYRLKQDYKQLESARLICYHVVNIQAQDGYKKTVTDWMPLATDHKEKVLPLTQAEIEEIRKKYK